MVNLEEDTDGTRFNVWKQEQMNSCGVASTWMARGLVKQQSFLEGEWGLALRLYRNAIDNVLAPFGVNPMGPVCLAPAAFPKDQSSMASTLANVGFKYGQLAKAIALEGIRTQVVNWTGTAQTIDVSKIGEDRLGGWNAAVVLIAWTDNAGKIVGGHFVVAARQAINGTIVFLDPGDGRVNQQSNNGLYRARYGASGFVGAIIYVS